MSAGFLFENRMSTDLRGKFDYASLSPNAHEDIDEFALLPMTDDHGAVVTYAAGL